MNAQDKAELRRLAEAMPNLDWDSPFEDHEQTGFCCVYAELFELDGEMHDGPTFVERCHPDQAKFIAEAKESVLSLLDECEGVTAERDDALAELESLRIQVSTLTEWYSNALDVISEVTAAIPGVTYMDPPDGGDVSIPEQIRRMAKDAELYRWVSSGAQEAETLVSVVLCHGGESRKVAERIAVYMEANQEAPDA